MFHTIVSIKNDGHYFCRAGGNRPDGLNEPVTSMAYLLRAYSFAKIGKYSEAEKDISYLDDEIKVAWLPHPEKEISKAVITSMLR